MNATTHSLVDDYLRQLERAARVLRRHQRQELVAEIRNHIDTGLAPDANEAEVRNLLDDLGSAGEIVAAAQPDRPPTRRGAREVVALILLLTGLPPILGWLAGVALLLWSPQWSTRQKLLGILVWPGGYLVTLGAGLAFTGSSRSCPVPVAGSTAAVSCTSSGASTWPIVMIGVLVVAPLLVAAYLYRAAGRRAAAV